MMARINTSDRFRKDLLKRIVGIAVMIAGFAAAASAGGETPQQTRQFLDGVQYYNEGSYADAVDAFSTLADSGIRNGKLYYNLGNACFKTGDIGRAVLWYERALKLNPHDPDLKFNLEYARTFVKDKEDTRNISAADVLFFWKDFLGPRAIQWTTLVLNLTLWILLSVQFVFRIRRFKAATWVAAAATAVFLSTAVYDYVIVHFPHVRHRQAIVLPSETPVRSGLSEASTELFKLHAGTKIRIDKEKDDYYRIFFSKGKIGWIPRSDAGIIEYYSGN